jgi:hypothetical protein
LARVLKSTDCHWSAWLKKLFWELSCSPHSAIVRLANASPITVPFAKKFFLIIALIKRTFLTKIAWNSYVLLNLNKSI